MKQHICLLHNLRIFKLCTYHSVNATFVKNVSVFKRFAPITHTYIDYNEQIRYNIIPAYYIFIAGIKLM